MWRRVDGGSGVGVSRVGGVVWVGAWGEGGSRLHPSHDEIISSTKSSRAQGSKRTVQPLNALWALHLYPVFENEKIEESDEKLVQQ